MDPYSAAVQGVFQTGGAIYAAKRAEKQAEKDRALQLAMLKFQSERENIMTEGSMTTNALQALTATFNKSFLK